MTLGDGCSGTTGLSAVRKKGSSLHDMSVAGRALGGGGAGGAGGGAGGAGWREADAGGVVLKNCVKLPSPDAESDMPCDENPFDRAPGAGKGGGVRGDSSALLAGGAYAGVLPETKILVNSPGAWSAGGELLAGGVATGGFIAAGAGGAGAGAGAEDGRGPRELNNCVNSPGPADPDPADEDRAGEDAAAGGAEGCAAGTPDV